MKRKAVTVSEHHTTEEYPMEIKVVTVSEQNTTEKYPMEYIAK
jgi:hypothetical protein